MGAKHSPLLIIPQMSRIIPESRFEHWNLHYFVQWVRIWCQNCDSDSASTATPYLHNFRLHANPNFSQILQTGNPTKFCKGFHYFSNISVKFLAKRNLENNCGILTKNGILQNFRLHAKLIFPNFWNFQNAANYGVVSIIFLNFFPQIFAGRHLENNSALWFFQDIGAHATPTSDFGSKTAFLKWKIWSQN